MKYMRILLISLVLVGCTHINKKEVQYSIFYENGADFSSFEQSQVVTSVTISSQDELPEVGNDDILVYFDTVECKDVNECKVPLHLKIKNEQLNSDKVKIKVNPSEIKLLNIKYKK